MQLRLLHFSAFHVQYIHVYMNMNTSVAETKQCKATAHLRTALSCQRIHVNELPQAGLEPTTLCVLGRCSTN